MLDKFGKSGRINALSLLSALRACGGRRPQNNLTDIVSARIFARRFGFSEVASSTGNGCAPCFR